MEIIRTTILGLKRITVGLLAAGFIIGILAGLAYGLGYLTAHLLSLNFHNNYIGPGLIELSIPLFILVTAFYLGNEELPEKSNTEQKTSINDKRLKSQ